MAILMIVIYGEIIDKNSTEVDITPALGEITTACIDEGQGNWVIVHA